MNTSKTIREKEYINNFLNNRDFVKLNNNKGACILPSIVFGIVFIIVSFWHSTPFDARVIAIITALSCIATIVYVKMGGKYLFLATVYLVIILYGTYLEGVYMFLSISDLGYLIKKVYIGAGILFAAMMVMYIVKGLYVKTGLKDETTVKKQRISTWLPIGMVSGGIGYYIVNSASNKGQQSFAIVFTVFSLLCLSLFSYAIINGIAKYYLIVKYDMDSLIREKMKNDKEIINTKQ